MLQTAEWPYTLSGSLGQPRAQGRVRGTRAFLALQWDYSTSIYTCIVAQMIYLIDKCRIPELSSEHKLWNDEKCIVFYKLVVEVIREKSLEVEDYCFY